MRFTLRILAFLLVAALASLVLHSRRKPRTDETEPYVRRESLEFYKSYASFLDESPDDLVRFLDGVATRSGLGRTEEIYPTDRESLQRAAEAFAWMARESYGFSLSLEDPDDTQLDRFVDAHLIDERLRPFLVQPESDRRQEYEEVYETIHVPNEPLLYYSMGAFWGEWLVKHRGAEWRLYPPLRPLQSFPDMVTASNTLCIHPFSQVTKKLGDPSGDQLAFKAKVSVSMKRQFHPYLLTASLADSEHAADDGLPAEFLEAERLLKAGRANEAVPVFERGLAAGVPNARLYDLALPAAWEAGRWDLVESWHLRALESEPRHPVLNHNLAVLYSNSPGSVERALPLLRVALEEEPNYARARITLASILWELGNTSEAREHASWVVANDEQLKSEGEEILRAMDDQTR
jgi:tetratricopeptide (TPR) repeat protein